MMERIEVKLFATLRKKFPVPESVEFRKSCSVGKILQTLGIPAEKVSIALVNGRHAELEDSVKPGDTLALFPPIGGG
jgi:molybdopterin converting factor small subunit